MTEILPPDTALIDEAVLFIDERFAAHVYHGYLEIGKYMLEKFFNNDIQLAGSRNAKKPVSYYVLCRRMDRMKTNTSESLHIVIGPQPC